jgi:MOSC domain-containing protein YiiM
VNYHLRALEQAGLVRRVGERRVGNFVESLFEADAGAYVVSAAGSWPLLRCDTTPAADRAPDGARGRLEGRVASIHLAPGATEPTVEVREVLAVASRGLEGDRYFADTGTFSSSPGGGRHVTLIEAEALAALSHDYGVVLSPGEARRNVVTVGVPLNHLVGRDFRVGEATLRGVRLCEPCAHLARLTHADVLPGLIHRGGLRADVVESGVMRAGDLLAAPAAP